MPAWALLDTIRAAVPWQKLRHAELGDKDPRMVLVRKQDLRIRRFEERAVTVSVLTVDASGSAAIARLAEAKGAVELILAQAYTKRSEVALIAFRGVGAELLLEPTRSLTRAKRGARRTARRRGGRHWLPDWRLPGGWANRWWREDEPRSLSFLPMAAPISRSTANPGAAEPATMRKRPLDGLPHRAMTRW